MEPLESQIQEYFQYETFIHQNFCDFLETLVVQAIKVPKGNGHELDTIAKIFEDKEIIKIINAFLASLHKGCMQKREVTTHKKCEKTSEKWRVQGNMHFRKRDYEKAYICYTECLKFAKPCEKNFVLAFSNRSAASYYANNKEIALVDVEMALSLPIADELKFKLHFRMCNIFFDLGMELRLDAALKKANDSLIYLDADVRDSSVRQLTAFQKKMAGFTVPKGVDNKIQIVQEFDNEELLCPKLDNENSLFVNASEKIAVKNSIIGRAVFATASIVTGDILFVEKPYAVAEIKNQDTLLLDTCDFCFKTKVNIYPCESCSRAQYCDRICFSKAWEKNHRFECAGGQMGLWSAIGVAHLATRVLMQGAIDRFDISYDIESAADLFQALDTAISDCKHDTAYISIYEQEVPGTSRDYIRVFHLNTNFNQMNYKDYLNYAMTSMMLSIWLDQYSDFSLFLTSQMGGHLPKNEVLMLMAALILRHIGQSISNAHSIEGELITHCRGYSEVQRPIVATGMFASASIMNHSCDSNIIKSFFQTTLVVKANSSIQTDLEVFNSYGPRYTEMPYKERQWQLEKQYGFYCRCSVCSDKDTQDYSKYFQAYKCPNCKGCLVLEDIEQVCQDCSIRNPDITVQLNQLDRASLFILQARESKESSRKLGLLKSALDIKITYLNEKHCELRDLREKIAEAYWENDEKRCAIHHMQEAVVSLQAKRRRNIVDLCHTLFKLSSMMNSYVEDATHLHVGHPTDLNLDNSECLLKQTLSTIQTAKNLHMLYLGNWSKTFRHLCYITTRIKHLMELHAG